MSNNFKTLIEARTYCFSKEIEANILAVPPEVEEQIDDERLDKDVIKMLLVRNIPDLVEVQPYENSTDTLLLEDEEECDIQLKKSEELSSEYSQRFPTRRVPNRHIFTAVEKRLRETSGFAPVTADYGRKHMLRTPVVDEEKFRTGCRTFDIKH
ncbi:hypothetical protein ILUMI_12385 [Ignelater luminosus]|uniref:Uncharacterized protein n=1 Tax=Ignelater luminosus TaxID=2038154 RepID=A0A8K0GBU9_IGNLU|nr:hypothetical protein ILUMI_12385 [Ignelater luminosus]